MTACRAEYERRYCLRNGRIVTIILRDTIIIEDPYLNLARAKALSVLTGEAFDSNRISRPIKDCLVKTNLSI
jgi:hypothetical protein